MSASSADGIGTSETNQTRGTQPRSFVRGYVSKALPRFPISARSRDLLFRSRDEVPPHEDLFGKWRPADEQQATSFAAGHAYFRTPATEVVQDSLLERLIIKPGVTLQDQQRVFERRLHRQCHALPAMHLDVGTEDFRKVNSG